MGYIRFVLSTRRIDDAGNAVQAVISRLDSDMADTSMLETGLIMHALAARGGKIIDIADFVLDRSRLDNNDLLE